MASKLKQPHGPQAARLRQRKHTVLAALACPPDALPGSLALTHRRCGTPSCHCAQGEGHPLWSLTFMVDGKKRVEWIPAAWVADVQRRVAAGRAFKEAVAEVLTANALLLVLERHQRRS
jgi:hypothetical protein